MNERKKKFSELIEGRLRPTILTRLVNDWPARVFTNVASVFDEIVDPFSVPVAKEILAHPSAIDVIIINLNKTGDEPERIVNAIKEMIRDIDAMYIFGHLSDVFVLSQVFKYVETNNEKAIVDFRYATNEDFTIEDLTKFIAGKAVAWMKEPPNDSFDEKPTTPPGVHRLDETKIECPMCGAKILVTIDDGVVRLICSTIFGEYKRLRVSFNLPDGFDDGELTKEKVESIPDGLRTAIGEHAFEPLAQFMKEKFKLNAARVAKEMSCYGSQEIGCSGYKHGLGEFYCRGFTDCGNLTARNLRIIGERIKDGK